MIVLFIVWRRHMVVVATRDTKYKHIVVNLTQWKLDTYLAVNHLSIGEVG